MIRRAVSPFLIGLIPQKPRKKTNVIASPAGGLRGQNN